MVPECLEHRNCNEVCLESHADFISDHILSNPILMFHWNGAFGCVRIGGNPSPPPTKRWPNRIDEPDRLSEFTSLQLACKGRLLSCRKWVGWTKKIHPGNLTMPRVEKICHDRLSIRRDAQPFLSFMESMQGPGPGSLNQMICTHTGPPTSFPRTASQKLDQNSTKSQSNMVFFLMGKDR